MLYIALVPPLTHTNSHTHTIRFQHKTIFNHIQTINKLVLHIKYSDSYIICSIEKLKLELIADILPIRILIKCRINNFPSFSLFSGFYFSFYNFFEINYWIRNYEFMVCFIVLDNLLPPCPHLLACSARLGCGQCVQSR